MKKLMFFGGNATPPPIVNYTVATGGVESFWHDEANNEYWRVHYYANTGVVPIADSFNVTQVGDDPSITVLNVGNGGSGGSDPTYGGGAAAGAFRTFNISAISGTWPIALGVPGDNGFGGGAAGTTNSLTSPTAVVYSSAGGPGGGSNGSGNNGPSGSGGGGANPGGAGTVGQGNDGAAGGAAFGGGGGGAGSDATLDVGGDASTSTITGILKYFAAGGDGCTNNARKAGRYGGGGVGGDGIIKALDAIPGTGSGGSGSIGLGLGGQGVSGRGGHGGIYIAYKVNPALVKPALDLSLPALTDYSGNNWNSTLGVGLPGGFTAPTVDPFTNNLVFSGNQTVALNAGFNITAGNNVTQFMLVYMPTAPEANGSFSSLGVQYRNGMGVFTDTRNGFKYVNAVGLHRDEDDNDEPIHGRGFPKMHSGYNLIGWSNSPTLSIFYLNGQVAYFTPNDAYSNPLTGGWLGAFPGGTVGNMFTIPANFEIPPGRNFKVWDFAMTVAEMQAYGDALLSQRDISIIDNIGDSITQGHSITNNQNTYTNLMVSYLNANTAHKWGACNIGVGGMVTSTMALIARNDNTSVVYNGISPNVNCDIKKSIAGATSKKITTIFAGINDFAGGASSAVTQVNFINWINMKTSLGYDKIFVFTPTSASAASMSAAQELQRLNYNAFLVANQAKYGYIVLDICDGSIPAFVGQPVTPNAYFSDSVHLTDLGAATVAAYANPIILANI